MKKRTFFLFRVILLVVLSGVMESSKKSLVAERWVINVSHVITLSRVGQVELLIRLPGQSVIPRSVADELLRTPEDDPARRAVEGGIFRIVVSFYPLKLCGHTPTRIDGICRPQQTMLSRIDWQNGSTTHQTLPRFTHLQKFEFSLMANE